MNKTKKYAKCNDLSSGVWLNSALGEESMSAAKLFWVESSSRKTPSVPALQLVINGKHAAKLKAPAQRDRISVSNDTR